MSACSHFIAPHCGCPQTSTGLYPTTGALANSAASVAHLDQAQIDALLADYLHLDGWANALTGIGEHGTDKREHSRFHLPILDYQGVINLWRGDAMAARAIELLPAECFSKGYDIVMPEDGEDQKFLDDVRDRMDELKVDEIVERAYRYERGFGGAAILMGLQDGGAIDEPLIPEKIKSLDWLTVMEPIEIYPASYYQDPNHPKYGEPEYYRQQAFTVSGAGTVVGVTDRRAPAPTQQLIHESRLIVFGGIRVSRYQHSANLMGPLWGDSVLQRVIEALRDYNVSWASAGLIAVDFAQSVISVENLMAIVAKHPDKVRDRMQAMNLMRSNARMILIDAKEKFQRESTNVRGFPEILDRLSQRMAADADIPLSMLLGVSPSGLGQPGQNDLALFHDRVRSAQRRRLTPPVQFLARTIMQTMRKYKIPKRFGVEWRNLVHQSDKDVAETRRTQAQTDSMYVKMGSLKPDEVRNSRWRRGRGYSYETQIDKGPAPGFIAPLPAGVMPKADPAEGVVRGVEADTEQKAEGTSGKGGGKKAAKPGPNTHVVGGYARRNPRGTALGAAPKEGGDKAPSDRNDAAHVDADGPGTRRTFAGLPIVVESPAGSTRKWTGGETLMKYDYGYVEGVQGADGDSVDVYLGPNENASHAYAAHQMLAPYYLHYDEDKVLLGFDSTEAAREAYKAHRDDGDRALSGMTAMTMEQFRQNYLGAGLAPLHTTTGNLDHLDFIEERGGKWIVLNEDKTKVLATENTKSEAVQRLRQIEYFKTHKQDAPGDEQIYGGWSEQGRGYELDKPDAPTSSGADVLWNEPLHTGAKDED